MINIKNFDSNLLDIRKLSSKSTDDVIYNIKYYHIESLDSEDPLYLIFNNVDDGYLEEEGNRNKCLILNSLDKNKEVLKKYTKLWNEIKNQIEAINGSKAIEYKKDFMKIRFKWGDDLLLDEMLNNPSMIIVVRRFSRRQQVLSTSLFTKMFI